MIDATGKFVMPGGVDVHTHFGHTFMGVTSVDDFAAGSRAAVAGGTTTVINVAQQASAGESLAAAVDRCRAQADNHSYCDYGLSVWVTQWTPATAADMAACVKERHVNSFLFSMDYKQLGAQVRDADLYAAMTACKQLGALARVHAENGDVIVEKQRQMLQLGVTGPEGHLQSRPEELEAEATNRACVLARQANCPVSIVRVAAAAAGDLIGRHRQNGTIVYGECTVAAVATDGTHYFNSCWRHAAAHVCAPPLRADPMQTLALMDMLASGGQLHMCASDHRAHSSEQKALGKDDFSKIPHGINGVEERLAVVWEKGVHSGKMDPMRFVAVTSTNAAKVYNVYPRKGRVAVGSDADVVVWDAAVKRQISHKTHASNSDFNVFEGVQCHGQPVIVVVGGRVVFENNSLAQPNVFTGRFVPLAPHAPFVYSVITQRERVCLPTKIDREPYRPGAAAASAKSPPLPAVRAVRNQFESSLNITGEGCIRHNSAHTQVQSTPTPAAARVRRRSASRPAASRRGCGERVQSIIPSSFTQLYSLAPPLVTLVEPAASQ